MSLPDQVRLPSSVAEIADELIRARRRSLALTTQILDDVELLAQHSRLMSPLVWDLAHVGNYEEQWLIRTAAARPGIRPDLDGIYDAFEHPRAARPQLPLLKPAEALTYLERVRAEVIDSLQDAPQAPAASAAADSRSESFRSRLLTAGFVYGLVLQHEHQHAETMLATHQLRRGHPVLPLQDEPAPHVLAPYAPAPHATRPQTDPRAEVLVPAGGFTMGTSSDPWAYDNETPAHVVELPAFWIDVTPVSVGAYRAFVESAGYDQERWWTPEGWRWRCESGRRHPAYWVAGQAGWRRRRFGIEEALPDDEPVQHVCWFEADAYSRWAGRRLPTEAEWEKTARWDPATGSSRRYPWGDGPPTPELANCGQRHYRPAPVGSYPAGASPVGARQLIGDVWEWTSSDFTPYPGFASFPYREYSQVFFGADYKVLRGGSWATDPLACRNTFRNWDYPIRRQIFAGFRTARDA